MGVVKMLQKKQRIHKPIWVFSERGEILQTFSRERIVVEFGFEREDQNLTEPRGSVCALWAWIGLHRNCLNIREWTARSNYGTHLSLPFIINTIGHYPTRGKHFLYVYACMYV